MSSGHQSLKGRLLLDGGQLRGSYFHRAVVLVCEHDRQGAFGLVLNRPSENRLPEVLSADLPERLKDGLLHAGGPVQPAALSYLYTPPALLAGNVLENVSVGHDLEELIELGRTWTPGGRLRVFAGYAGWAPGQLDDELRREAWLTHPATVERVFAEPAADLWRSILRSRPRWQERLLPDAPEDLSLN